MKARTTITLLAFTLIAGTFSQTAVAQERDTSRSRRSTGERSSRQRQDAASRGTLRYHGSDADSRSQDQSSDRQSDRSRDRSSEADRSRDRSSAERSDGSHRSTTRSRDESNDTDRSYPPHVRYHAGTGSISNYRRGDDRPTHLPSRPIDHEVRVRRYPRHGTHITQLPSLPRTIMHRGRSYYFSDGVYYRYSRGVYRVVQPPIGFSLSYLPAGYAMVVVHGQPYYRYDNTYYVYQILGNEPVYVVVEPPDDIIVDFLPSDCREVVYKGRLYYIDIYEERAYAPVIIDGYTRYRLTDLDVDVDFHDGRIEIEIDD